MQPSNPMRPPATVQSSQLLEQFVEQLVEHELVEQLAVVVDEVVVGAV
jgi:hypothetical protein